MSAGNPDDRFSINQFLDIKSAVAPSFSPDGKLICYLSNLPGTYQVFIIPTSGGTPKQLTSFDDPISYAVFSPVRNEIFFGKSVGGNEKTQIFVLDVVGRKTRALTDKPEVIHHWGGVSRDGRKLAYSHNERNGVDFDVNVMDLETGVSRCVFQPGGWCDSAGFSPSGKKLVAAKLRTFNDLDFYLIDLESGKAELLTAHKGDAELGIPRWLPDESGFFFTSNENRDFIGLQFCNPKTAERKFVLTPEWDIVETAITRDGRYIAVVINKEGYLRPEIYDVRSMQKLPSVYFPDGLISGLHWSDNGKLLAFNLEGAAQNKDVWVWSTEKNEFYRLTRSPCGVPEKIFVGPTLTNYQSFDGLKIPVFLYTPNQHAGSRKKFPVIIEIHGGPEGQFVPNFNPLIQYFVHRGYAVAAPNVRGSTGYGKKYLALDDRWKRLDSVADLAFLHKFLQTIPELDSEKMALMGASYGGYMVLAGLAFQPELWQAGVDIVGISNLETFLKNTSSWRRSYREAEYGYLATDRELLRKASPIHRVADIKAPLFIIHGANDPRVPLSEAEQIAAAIQRHGGIAKVLVYNDEGHGLSKLKNRLDAYPQVADFLDQWLS